MFFCLKSGNKKINKSYLYYKWDFSYHNCVFHGSYKRGVILI